MLRQEKEHTWMRKNIPGPGRCINCNLMDSEELNHQRRSSEMFKVSLARDLIQEGCGSRPNGESQVVIDKV